MRSGIRVTEVKRHLSEQETIGGVPFRLVLVNIVSGVFMFMILHVWWVPILLLALHFVLVQVNRNDPMALTVYQIYRRQGAAYLPFSEQPSSRNDRPVGFGRRRTY